MTYDLTPPLLLLLIHALAVAGLWRAAYFPLRPCPDPRGWGRRFPLKAVDRGAAGVLWPVRYVVERYLPAWCQAPLITCPACMATVWGPIPYAVYVAGGDPVAWAWYVLYWPALSAAAAAVAVVVNPER